MVHHVPSVGYDALLDVSGKVLRVQIKGTVSNKGRYSYTCKVETGRPDGKKRITRSLDRRDADLLALVSLDSRRVVFRVVPASGTTTEYVAASEFKIDEIEALSMRQALSDLGVL